MELDKELIFKVSVTFPDLLEKAIENHNKFRGTDFEIIEHIPDEVRFCKIKVSKYKPEDIFGLGYKLAALENKLKEEGEIDW